MQARGWRAARAEAVESRAPAGHGSRPMPRHRVPSPVRTRGRGHWPPIGVPASPPRSSCARGCAASRHRSGPDRGAAAAHARRSPASAAQHPRPDRCPGGSVGRARRAGRRAFGPGWRRPPGHRAAPAPRGRDPPAPSLGCAHGGRLPTVQRGGRVGLFDLGRAGQRKSPGTDAPGLGRAIAVLAAAMRLRRHPEHVRPTVQTQTAPPATSMSPPAPPRSMVSRILSRRGVDAEQPAVRGGPDGSEADGHATDARGIQVDRGDGLARDRIDADELRLPVGPCVDTHPHLCTVARDGTFSGKEKPTSFVAVSMRTSLPVFSTLT